MRKLITLAALAALTATAGCDAIGAVAGLPTGAGGNARVNGKVFAPATQVAIVAAGGLNYSLAARPDEAVVPNATVRLEGGPTATTSTTGAFTVEVPTNKIYKTTVTFKTKAGGNANLIGAVVVGTGNADVELDAANYMVASKAYQAGKAADGAKLTAAITAMRTALQAASRVPEFTDQAGAASAFDTNANAEVKAALGL